jgi:hypothetical protein
MTLNLDRMRLIAENLYITAIESAFGEEGQKALRTLIDTLMQLYRVHDPAERHNSLALFIRPDAPNATVSVGKSPRYELASVASIMHELDDPCVVEITQSGAFRIFAAEDYDPHALSSEAIVYTYDNKVEHVLVAGKFYRLINPAENFASIFVRPTFGSLEAALERYRTHVAPDTSCFILAEAWSDEKRLFLKAKPESTIRRSLHQHLRTLFAEAEVRPEQIVDESHPVDIKVTWPDTNRRALIEIKWLGGSRNADGTLATHYTEARAREGAKQLADYLDGNKTAGPGLSTKGYLVVFDARRRGLSEVSTSVTGDDGLHYRDREIRFDPEYHKIRGDFAAPVRCFANPVLN